MAKIRVKTPAKINLSLKVGNVRPDGFHPVESVMAAVNLFDYIDIETFEKKDKKACSVDVDSNSSEIPHDSSNIAYRAAELFLQACPEAAAKIGHINIYIEKNIPVCAGLAGGSTNASGVIWGLNKIFDRPLDDFRINSLLATLGSDLNFCLAGGIKLCKGRGEKLFDMEFQSMPVTLIKPVNLKVSAKEAYQKFDEANAKGMKSNFLNDLEFALLPYYKEIKYLHDLGFQMSGSGPTFFAKQAFLEPEIKEKLSEEYLIIENLNTFNGGVLEA